MTHQCKETKRAKREQSWCCCPKENTPSIQILPRLKKPNKVSTVITKTRGDKRNTSVQWRKEGVEKETAKWVTSVALVSFNQSANQLSHPYIFSVLMFVRSSPVFLILIHIKTITWLITLNKPTCDKTKTLRHPYLSSFSFIIFSVADAINTDIHLFTENCIWERSTLQIFF